MIIDGKAVANRIKQELQDKIAQKPDKRAPVLTIITVGEDPASQVYVRNKMRTARDIGIEVRHLKYCEGVGEFFIRSIIEDLNKDKGVDGIMVQLPLPEGYDAQVIVNQITPSKDVDGLTTTNMGLLRQGVPKLIPCTARGIIDLLDAYGIPIDGSLVTILGRSNIVGKPVADLLMARGATVTQCHSRTPKIELVSAIWSANILISAIGKPLAVEAMPGQVIIDVGINRDAEGKLCGDIANPEVGSAYTPVPGGVGPMTVVELMKNVVEVWYERV